MTADPERALKDRLLHAILKDYPDLSPRLLAAIIRIPRTPFFPEATPEQLFSSFHPKGWGGRFSPSILDTLLILTEAEIRPGDRIGIFRLTDPYFLLLLLELTHRIFLVEDNPEILSQIRQSVIELGYSYIPVLPALSELSSLSPPVRSILYVGSEGDRPFREKDGRSIPEHFTVWKLGGHLEKMSS
ncbi:MAG: hypothetical protein ACYC9S_07970 [Leptospirales bacterium]